MADPIPVYEYDLPTKTVLEATDFLRGVTGANESVLFPAPQILDKYTQAEVDALFGNFSFDVDTFQHTSGPVLTKSVIPGTLEHLELINDYQFLSFETLTDKILLANSTSTVRKLQLSMSADQIGLHVVVDSSTTGIEVGENFVRGRGLSIADIDAGVADMFTTKEWVLANAVGITDAPIDGNQYGRRNAAWTAIPTTDLGNFGFAGDLMQISGEDILLHDTGITSIFEAVVFPQLTEAIINAADVKSAVTKEWVQAQGGGGNYANTSMIAGGTGADNATALLADLSSTDELFIPSGAYDIDAVTLPANKTLRLENGAILTATITGDNTRIEAGMNQIFDITSVLDGTWNVEAAPVEWFGAIGDGVTESAACIQKTLDTFTPGQVVAFGDQYSLEHSIEFPAHTNYRSKKETKYRNTPTMREPLFKAVYEPIFIDGGFLNSLHYSDMDGGTLEDGYNAWLFDWVVIRSYRASTGEDKDNRRNSVIQNMNIESETIGERWLGAEEYIAKGLRVISDTTSQTSGVVDVWINYLVVNYVAGDDFSNVTSVDYTTNGNILLINMGETVPNNWSNGTELRKVNNSASAVSVINVRVAECQFGIYLNGDPYSGMVNSFKWSNCALYNNYTGMRIDNRAAGHVISNLIAQPKNVAFDGVTQTCSSANSTVSIDNSYGDQSATYINGGAVRLTRVSDNRIFSFNITSEVVWDGTNTVFDVEDMGTNSYALDMSVDTFDGCAVMLGAHPTIEVNSLYNQFAGMAWDVWYSKTFLFGSESAFNDLSNFGMDRGERFITNNNIAPLQNRVNRLFYPVLGYSRGLQSDYILRLGHDGTQSTGLNQSTLIVSGEINFATTELGGKFDESKILLDNVLMQEFTKNGIGVAKPLVTKQGIINRDVTTEYPLMEFDNSASGPRILSDSIEQFTYPFTLYAKGVAGDSFNKDVISVCQSGATNLYSIWQGQYWGVYRRDGSLNTAALSSISVNMGEPFEAMIVFLDATTINFFINGNYEQLTVPSSTIPTITYVQAGAGRWNPSTAYFTGRLERAMWFNTEVTPSQLARISSGLSSGSPLVDWHKNMTNAMWADDSGNGNDSISMVNSTPFFGDEKADSITIQDILTLEPSAAPATPNNGDIWLQNTDGLLYAMLNGNTVPLTLGSYLFDKQTAIVITTEHPTWQPVNSLAYTIQPGVRIYEFKMSFTYTLDSINTSAYARFSLDNGVTWQEFRAEPKDKTDARALYYSFPKEYNEPAAANNTFLLEFAKENGADVMEVSFSDIIVQQVK